MSKQTNSKMVSWEMKWVMGKYLTKPYQSIRSNVGFADWIKRSSLVKESSLNKLLVQLNSYQPTYQPTYSIMPAHCGVVRNITSSGSFIMRESSHNRDRFPCAWDNPSRPYPSYEGVYIHSDNHDLSLDEFQDLGLNDFLVAQRRVARYKLERLQLTPHQGSLLSRGVQPHWEQ